MFNAQLTIAVISGRYIGAISGVEIALYTIDHQEQHVFYCTEPVRDAITVSAILTSRLSPYSRQTIDFPLTEIQDTAVLSCPPEDRKPRTHPPHFSLSLSLIFSGSLKCIAVSQHTAVVGHSGEIQIMLLES